MDREELIVPQTKRTHKWSASLAEEDEIRSLLLRLLDLLARFVVQRLHEAEGIKPANRSAELGDNPRATPSG
jgi:hypothetical protein